MRCVWIMVLVFPWVLSCRDDDHAGSDDTSTGGDGDADSDGDADGDADADADGDDSPIGGPFSGDGTYYAATGDGACMLGPSPNDMDVAAINQPQWDGSAWCGACADVTGPKGRVRVRIVDLCPECREGDLDFSEQAFGKIADMAAGRVPIDWSFVPCAVSGNVSYKYKDGTHQWWTAVQVRNHRRPIATLEWSPDGSSWRPTARTDYNYFLDDGGFGPDGVKIRVTAIDGQVIEDDLPPVVAELEVEGTAQFR